MVIVSGRMTSRESFSLVSLDMALEPLGAAAEGGDGARALFLVAGGAGDGQAAAVLLLAAAGDLARQQRPWSACPGGG